MNRPTTVTLATMALLCLTIALPAGNSVAQQKQQVSFKVPAENNKITQQLNIDVGDVPNHIVRVFETHAAFPNNAPVINGLKLVEWWSRGIVDLIDSNGSTTQYSVFVMENGDKFFARSTNVLQNTSGKTAITGVGYVTGGTGKFAAIQGIVRQVTNIDFKANSLESQNGIEYSIGK
jgi:hypothetical protein